MTLQKKGLSLTSNYRKTQKQSSDETAYRLVMEHQLWLRSNGRFGQRLEQSKIVFKNLNLDGMDFSKARLDFAYFKGGSLRGARFGRTDWHFSELEFRDVYLDGADFTQAYLRYALFEGGSLRKAKFMGANLHSASFFGCDVTQANFSSADLQWATFDTNHQKASFNGARLYHTAWNRQDGIENDALYASYLMSVTPGIAPSQAL